MKALIADEFEYLFHPKRYKVAYGGRGSGKSWGFARALVIVGAQRKIRVLCARELQNSIRESVHKTLTDQIDMLGLGHLYEIQKSTIIGKNGTEFIFEGIKNNVSKIKSMEGITHCWVEEAESVSDDSWKTLIPTIRKSGSEIWVTFNPRDITDATCKRFIKEPPKDSTIKKINWRQNPWFTDEMRAEMEELKLRDFNEYLHVWEGEPRADMEDAIIKPEWFESAVDAHVKLNIQPIGIKSVGFDPADEGGDAKALCYRHGSVILKVEQWHSGDVTNAVDRAFNFAYDNQADTLIYDSIGIGATVKMGLEKRIAGKNIQVHPFCASERPENPEAIFIGKRKNKDFFRNLRAQAWYKLRERFEKTHRAVEKGEYIDPDQLIALSSQIEDLDEIRSELCRPKRIYTENGLFQVESKIKMRARDVESPNMADAIVMSFFGGVKLPDNEMPYIPRPIRPMRTNDHVRAH